MKNQHLPIFLLINLFQILIGVQVLAQNPQALESNYAKWKWQNLPNTLALTLEGDTLRTIPHSDIEVGKEWWKIFQDSELDRLESLAQEENYDLIIIKNRIREAQARIKIAQAAYYPQIQLNPNFTYQSLAPNRPIGFDIPLERVGLNTYNIPLEITYEVDVWGRLRSAALAARYNGAARVMEEKALLLEVTSLVALNFFALRALDTQKTILKRTYTTRLDNLEIVEIRFQAGLVNEIDVQRAKTELASVEVQLKNNALLRNELEIALATLCGQNPNALQIPENDINYLSPTVVLDAPESISNKRPDMRQLALQIKSIEAQANQTKKNMYPRLNLLGSIGLLSGESEDLFSAQSQTWLLGLNVSIPLFEGGRRRAALEANDYQLEAARESLEQLNIEAYGQVETALSNLGRLEEQLEAQQKFVEAAQKAAILSKQRYTKGLVTYLEVADAERIVLNAELLAAQLLGQQLQTTVVLIQALGGGNNE